MQGFTVLVLRLYVKIQENNYFLEIRISCSNFQLDRFYNVI